MTASRFHRFARSVARRALSAFSAWALALSVIALGPVAFASAAQAQNSVAAESTVRIQGETRITKLADLDFGAIIAGSAGGTISVAPNGNVASSGSVIVANAAQQAAVFELEREIFQDFPTYQGPAGVDSIEIVHVSVPSARMTVRDFTTDFNRTGFFGLPAYFFRTTFDFRVGGTLDVAADQEPGLYVGTFTVIIDYN